ncbi:Chromatin assembly factor 1 subunit B, partial [Cichlidogyrus casuarinus]
MNAFFASLSCDRSLRIYSLANKQCIRNSSKVEKESLFQDDSWKSFFRRLSFSPDGLLLLCPAGNLEGAHFAGPAPSPEDPDRCPPQHAAHLFARTSFTKPIVSYPCGVQPVVGTRFCKRPFKLRSTGSKDTNLIDLAYRWIFCLILEDGLLLCDTQHPVPFAHVNQIHYQALNDAAWSDDGSLLVACSTDGYCSLLYFTSQDLGQQYSGPIGISSIKINPSPTKTELNLDVTLTPVVESIMKKESNQNKENTNKKRRVPLVTLSSVPLGSETDSLSKDSKSESSNPQIIVTKRRLTLTTLSDNPDDGAYEKEQRNARASNIRIVSQSEGADSDCTLGEDTLS